MRTFAFAIPLWVLSLQAPWPVVFLALCAATAFTPLIDGPAHRFSRSESPRSRGQRS